MRPPAPARGPAHTSLCRWIVFVVDHWLGAGLSHPNFLIILVHPFVHTQKNLLETQATVATRSRSRSFGRVFSCYRALYRQRWPRCSTWLPIPSSSRQFALGPGKARGGTGSESSIEGGGSEGVGEAETRLTRTGSGNWRGGTAEKQQGGG